MNPITKDNIATLQRYAWPGNVRELRNVVERALIVAESAREAPCVQFDFVMETRGLDYVAEVRNKDGMLESTPGV